MANEYLKRTPTSTGNQKVWTVSVWIKQIDITGGSGNGSFLFGYYDEGASPTPRGSIQLNESATAGKHSIGWNPTGNTWYQTTPEGRYKDNQNWYHLLVAIDTTKPAESDGVQMYFNGIKRESESYLGSWGSGAAALNIDTGFNSIVEHYIGAFAASLQQSKIQYSDFFYIDGQQLGPEVFGFYKDGNGYISAGSTQATDFRNGQWVPRTPREIKNLINDNGGFGVNGFYLPMNDSSNFGADFHTTPNSIITLKGENLPQPRNGAPTTTDAYVSQLRSDPYAANLVLAVPGISTSTSANLVTNGNFDSNVSGWTAVDATIVWRNGRALVNRTGGTGPSAYRAITTVIGQRYTLSGIVDSTGTGGRGDIRAYSDLGSTMLVNASGTVSTVVNVNTSFTATTTTTYIYFTVDNTGTAYFDNVVVKQEDAPLDYSADIKGSGTNKTLTANGNAGVGYEIPSYYGSAMTFDGTGDAMRAESNADFNLGDGDYTIEGWFYRDIATSHTGSYCLWAIGGVNNEGTLTLFYENGGFLMLRGRSPGDGSYTNIIYVSNHNHPVQQWAHICTERHNGVTTVYLNGVAIETDISDSTTVSQGYFAIGAFDSGGSYSFDGYIQDLRVYKGVAKYKGSFDVSKPYTPVGIGTWRAVSDTCQNNFATLNSLDTDVIPSLNGNLSINQTTAIGWHTLLSTHYVSSGKWYAEMRIDTLGWIFFGVDQTSLETRGKHIGGQSGSKGVGLVYTVGPRGDITYNGANSVYTPANTPGASATAASGDIISIALDLDNNNIKFYKNNILQYDLYNLLESGADYTFGISPYSIVAATANFGQNPTFSGNTTAGTYTDSNGKGLFKYQPPSGFLALCEDNLPTPAIKDPGEHFKTVLYTGDDSNSRGIVGVGFKPDLVWIKQRDTSTENHQLQDSIRGATNRLFSNLTAAESPDTNSLRSFDNDGFSLGTSDNYNGLNRGYVAWCWKAGGAAVTNTDGSITSQVSVNQDAGFSIATYTGTGSTGSIGHGLGKTPAFVITKHRNLDTHWRIWHKSLTAYNYTLFFNTGAQQSQPAYSALPTSSVINLAGDLTGAYNFVTYSWAEIEGFSKFGSYVGNGNADGPFVYCGFKPAFVLQRAVNSLSDWTIMDSSRSSTNPNRRLLYANLANIEGDGVDDRNPDFLVDFVSNGFKVRATNNDLNNTEEYIFMAFAESPFQTANAK